MRLELTDTRRLTGPNLLLPGAGAVLEIACDDADVETVIAAWTDEVTKLLSSLDWGDAELGVRAYRGGASLAFSAPIDVLYAACEVNEAAWNATVATLNGGPFADRDEVLAALIPAIATERAPRWLELQAAAADRDVAFLWDDDEVSIGLGTGSRTWPVSDLPAPDEIGWEDRHDVPTVIVTGTNGKSTTVRLLAKVLRTAGIAAGLTSTDGIHVGDQVVEAGDFSGPGGARTLLRHPGVEIGVLEVARGGLLRRGLPIDCASAAIVTNISDDHLGEYGIDDLDELADAKLIVAQAVAEDGVLVLNADDPLLVAHAPVGQQLAWFSLEPDNEVLIAAVGAGNTVWTVQDGVVVEVAPDGVTPICPVADIPVTVAGAARHNVANALGATALARILGLSPEEVAVGLRAFRGDDQDNPGRANRFEVGGATVIVDFAHNPAGMHAIAETSSLMPSRRRLVLFGQAGDRSDRSITELAQVVWSTHPDRVIAIDIPNYLRGRQPMEVPGVIRDALVGAGADPGAIELFPDPVSGVDAALAWAEPGDLLLLMILDGRGPALERLRGLSDS